MPVLPLRLFACGSRSRAYLARALFSGSMMGYYFFASEEMQEVYGFTLLRVGIAFFPLTLFTFAGAMLVPRMVMVCGNKRTLLFGLCLLAAGFMGALFFASDSSYWQAMACPMALLGLGQGLATSPMTNLGIQGVEAADSGAASGMVNVSHQIGCSLGLSLMVAFNVNVEGIGYMYSRAMMIAFFLIIAALAAIFLKTPRHGTAWHR